MVRAYELMLILRPDFGVPARNASSSSASVAGGEEKAVRELVGKFTGGLTVDTLTVMGKKALAYPIKKQKEGVYVLATVKGEAVKVSELERQMKLGTDILRYLLIVK